MSLRRWQIAIGSVILALLAITVLFYFYAQNQARKTLAQIPAKLGDNVAQRAVGFSYSKSEAGRTLFTIKASELVQFKDQVRAELRGVSVVVYGRQGDRYDQISGDVFTYDQKTQEIRADGPVSIDLEANPKTLMTRPDQAPPEETKNPLHLRTSGIVFSQATGIAKTTERVEVRTVQGEGSAVGAEYDSHTGFIRFDRDVVLKSGSNELRATSATVQQTGQQRTILLHEVTLRAPERRLQTPEMSILVASDNHIDRITADGGFTLQDSSREGENVTGRKAVLTMAQNGSVARADFAGGVHANSSRSELESDRVELHFANNKLLTADLQGGTTARQPDGSQLKSDHLHLEFADGNLLHTVHSDVPAEITINETANRRTAVVDADRMDAAFNAQGQISHLHAAPNAKIVSHENGKPDRSSHADALEVTFVPEAARPALSRLVETGDVRVEEATRRATSQRLEYDAGSRIAVLTGSPFVTDSGMTLGGDRVELESGSGNAKASGDVRLSYRASSGKEAESAHAVASEGSVTRVQGRTTAVLTGSPVRLWEGGSIITGPRAEVDREQRTAIVTSDAKTPVIATFLQQPANGADTPVTVTARQLTYFDVERRAHFTGGVKVRGVDGTMTAEDLTLLLQPAARPAEATATSAQVRQIVATGQVELQQPGRKGHGDRLIYDAAEARFRLNGKPDSPASIFDAERGTITGDSLTFYSRDGRVLVESQGKRAVTRTYVNANTLDRRNR